MIVYNCRSKVVGHESYGNQHTLGAGAVNEHQAKQRELPPPSLCRAAYFNHGFPLSLTLLLCLPSLTICRTVRVCGLSFLFAILGLCRWLIAVVGAVVVVVFVADYSFSLFLGSLCLYSYCYYLWLVAAVVVVFVAVVTVFNSVSAVAGFDSDGSYWMNTRQGKTK